METEYPHGDCVVVETIADDGAVAFNWQRQPQAPNTCSNTGIYP